MQQMISQFNTGLTPIVSPAYVNQKLIHLYHEIAIERETKKVMSVVEEYILVVRMNIKAEISIDLE